MLDLGRFKALTFDCYGTLIDWEAGIAGTLEDVLSAHGVTLPAERLLASFGRHEEAVEGGPYRRYRDVLTTVARGVAAEVGVTLTDDEAGRLPASLPQWPVFGDTVASLAALAQRYRLGILSNTDDDLFAATRQSLRTDFDWVVTAEQVGSYKPSPRNFEALIERVGLPPEEILHVAQSRFHDVVPGRAAGLATACVHRRGAGATVPVEAEADLEVPDLRTLAELAAEAR